MSLKPQTYYLDGRPHCKPGDFVIKSENYGIPQSRHRVIVLGIREDLAVREIPVLRLSGKAIPASEVLDGLPRLRSGVTHAEDGRAEWRAAVASILDLDFMHSRRNGTEGELREYISKTVHKLRNAQADRGGEFVPYDADCDY